MNNTMENNEMNNSNLSDNDILNQYLQKQGFPKANQTETEEDSIVPGIVIITIWIVIYAFTYIFRIELNFWFSLISLLIVELAIFYTLPNIDNKYFNTKAKKSFTKRLMVIISIILMIALIPLFMHLNAMHYFRTKLYLAEAPIGLPHSLMNANKNTFFSELKHYENTTQRLFYFDLQWSIRYAKNTKQEAQYQRLEQLSRPNFS